MEVIMTQEEIRRLTEAGLLQTPCYIFDEDELAGRVRQMKEALASCGAELCFAVKANPFLIPLLDPVIGKYEVCSPGELEICRRYGIAGEKIIFSGVVKSYDDIKTALAYPVGEITIESFRHWQILRRCMPAAGEKVRVLLRLTSGAQFGMEEQTIHAIIEEIQSMRDITFAGIHFFAGTQRKGSKYEKELAMLAQFMTSLQEKYGLAEMRLEYGPGLCVAYFEGETVEEGAEAVHGVAEWIEGQPFPYPVTIELGRYVAASCGHYVTQIMDVKKAGERKYCLIDGGIHHINYYGQNMAMRTPVIHHIPAAGHKLEDTMSGEYMICGALCTFADLVARGLTLRDPQIEDFLVFDRIGAYSVTEGSYLFLSRDLPVLYTYRKDAGLKKIRDRIAAWEINVAEHVREEDAFCTKE